MLGKGPAFIKLVFYRARRITNKINTHQGIYYQGNKQSHEINLLEKTGSLKVVRESISEKVALSETQMLRICQV